MAKWEPDGRVSRGSPRHSGGCGVAWRRAAACRRSEPRGEAAAPHRRPPRRARRQASRAPRPARPPWRVTRVRRRRRPRPLGRGDLGSAVERTLRLGRVRPRRRPPFHRLEASRLARPARALRPAQRPRRPDDHGCDRCRCLTDSERPLRDRGEALRLIRASVRLLHPRPDRATAATARGLGPSTAARDRARQSQPAACTRATPTSVT